MPRQGFALPGSLQGPWKGNPLHGGTVQDPSPSAELAACYPETASFLSPLSLITLSLSLTSTLRLVWTLRARLQRLTKLCPTESCFPYRPRLRELGTVPLPCHLRGPRSEDPDGLSKVAEPQGSMMKAEPHPPPAAAVCQALPPLKNPIEPSRYFPRTGFHGLTWNSCSALSVVLTAHV